MRIPSKLLLNGVLCMAIVLCAVLRSVRADDDAATPAPTAQVQVMPLKRGTLPRTVMLYGTVQSSTATRQSVQAPGGARVAEIRVRTGETVPKDAPLAVLAPTPATSANYTQAQSALRIATDMLARTRAMSEQHLATAQQVADAEKAESDARSSLTALEAQGAGGPLLLRAPFAATVTALATSVGAIVSEGDALLELARPSDLVVAAGAVPTSAAQIAVGNTAHVVAVGTTAAEDDDDKAGAPITGRVSMRGAAVDPNSGLVPVEVSLPNNALFPGEGASVSITTGTLQGYIVPHSAVLLNDEGETYVVQAVNGVAKKVPVKVLGRQNDQDAVDGELTANAPLVLAGNYQLDDDMKLQIAPAAGAAAPDKAKDDQGDKKEAP